MEEGTSRKRTGLAPSCALVAAAWFSAGFAPAAAVAQQESIAWTEASQLATEFEPPLPPPPPPPLLEPEAAQVGLGPLRLASQSPFQSFRIGFLPRTASDLDPGQFELRETLTWVNIWAQKEGEYLLDYETLHSSLSFGYGVTETWMAEVEFADRSRFGGAMDSFIEEFHDAFELGQAKRHRFPRDDFRFDLAARGGDPSVSLSDGDRGWFSRSLQVTVQNDWLRGGEGRPALAWSLTARMEAEHQTPDIESSGPIDVAGSVSIAGRLSEPLHGYWSVGWAWFGDEEFHGVELQSTQISSLAALEWRYREGAALLFQYLLSDGVLEGDGPFARPSHEVTLGWKARVAGEAVLEIGVIENIVTFDNSPDLGFHVGLSWRL